MEKDKSSSQIAVTIRELGKTDSPMGSVFLAHQTEEGLKVNFRMEDGRAEPQTMIDSLWPTIAKPGLVEGTLVTWILRTQSVTVSLDHFTH